MRSVQFGSCPIIIFFFFLSSLSSFSIGIFLDNSWRFAGLQARERKSFFFYFPHSTTHKHSLSSSGFLPLLFNRSVCNYQTDSWWDLFSFVCILFPFSLMQLSRSYWLWHFKVTLWEFELISNYHLSITKQTP